MGEDMGGKKVTKNACGSGRYHVRAFTTGMCHAGRLAGGKVDFMTRHYPEVSDFFSFHEM